MALATRCPHCQTTFRVAHDQLKLRAGLVRCGACKEIFNGVEHLLRPDEMQQVLSSPKPKAASALSNAAPSAPSAPSAPQAPVSSHASSDQILSSLPSTNAASHVESTDTGISPAPLAPSGAENYLPKTAAPVEPNISSDLGEPAASHDEVSRDTASADPLQRMTLMDITAFDDGREAKDELVTDEARLSYADRSSDVSMDRVAHPDTGDELSQAIDDLHNKPWRREKRSKKGGRLLEGSETPGKAEPNFMAHARRQKRYGRAMRLAMGAGSVFLFIALLLQGMYAFRHVIAATMPEYRPILMGLCAKAGCQISLPAHIDKVSIESSELQSLPSSPSKFTLVALLRNQATTSQAWPHLELTLNDMNEKPVARKVFQPSEYLASTAAVQSGFPEQSEHQIRIAFEMLQLKAAGYRLYLFYP